MGSVCNKEPEPQTEEEIIIELHEQFDDFIDTFMTLIYYNYCNISIVWRKPICSLYDLYEFASSFNGYQNATLDISVTRTKLRKILSAMYKNLNKLGRNANIQEIGVFQQKLKLKLEIELKYNFIYANLLVLMNNLLDDWIEKSKTMYIMDI